MSKVREIAWPDEYTDLKRIEEFMVCGICYEYMETSVMTPCSHNYCSLCIRKYLHYKTQCPACFHNFFEKDLYINRTMDGLIRHYLQIREKLVSLIQHRSIYNTVTQLEPEPSTPPLRPARNSQLLKSPKVSEAKQIEPKTPIVNSPLASTSKFDPSSPIASRSPKVIIPSIAKIFNTPKRKEIVPQPVANIKSVSCPVCKVDISEHHVNVHLDACLKREVAQETAKEKPAATKRPTLPKLVLRVMKDAELRKKMKEFGLSAQGDRRILENRFTRYSTIYNAECDKVDPRPISDLIRQCDMEEKQERKMDSFLVSTSVPAVRLQIERNAKEEKIEEAQKYYRDANKSSFDKLIEAVKNRRKIEKAKQPDSETASSTDKPDNESASTSSKPSTSAANESVLENISENEENAAYNPSAEIAFQDSDSDESCPLQHYRSDDPMKYLSVNLNDSSPCTSASASPVKRPQRIKIENNDEEKKPSITNNASDNPYEVTTDESSDDDIPSSPILNKNTNRKRVKLSNRSLNKSRSEENNSRQAEARDLCNSIIKDFSFDGLSDDSLSEFAVKHKTEAAETVRDVKVNESLKEANNLNQSNLQKEIDFSCDKKVPDENSIDNFSFDILNGDSSAEFIDISVTDPKEAREQTAGETLKSSPPSNDAAKPEKENVASSANENSQPPASEAMAVHRPVRKRNRPARFAEIQPAKKATDGEKTRPIHVANESQDSESPDNFKSASSDGSLKRRRGRPKAIPKDRAADEAQNPPKRPVRRRQAAPDRSLC